ncbi:MAG: MBL fold metallo-hydrolase [Candidatus Kariarchaeaceae archaeon]|jgi:glyoxylase-like metal-dependent hydrolase (beta-lactamase superfamily II)
MIKFEEITPNVVTCTTLNKSGNFGGVALSNYCIAIDSTHNVETGRKFQKALEKYFGLPMKYLFLTHFHSDHTGGMSRFYDTEIVSSKATAKLLRNRKGSKPSNLFEESLVIDDHGVEIRIKHHGGHTPGSSSVYFPSDKILFTGDLIFEDIIIPFTTPNSNPDKWIKALEYFQKLDLNIIVPGHGQIIDDKRVLDDITTYFKKIRESIKKTISNKTSQTKFVLPDNIDKNVAYERVIQHRPYFTRKRFDDVYETRKKTVAKHWYNYFKKNTNINTWE